jgi:purine-nucleoside phosphorylase
MEGMEVGDIMLIEDHINMQSANPLHGPNDERWGPRFPDMLYTYDPDLLEKANSYAAQKGYKIHKGVYVGVTGPTFETPAEYRMFHRMGGGAVGMSTVPEVIVARHMGLKIFGLSVIADIGYPTEAIVQISHDIVVEKAKASEPIMTDIVQHIIGEF